MTGVIRMGFIANAQSKHCQSSIQITNDPLGRIIGRPCSLLLQGHPTLLGGAAGLAQGPRAQLWSQTVSEGLWVIKPSGLIWNTQGGMGTLRFDLEHSGWDGNTQVAMGTIRFDLEHLGWDGNTQDGMGTLRFAIFGLAEFSYKATKNLWSYLRLLSHI